MKMIISLLVCAAFLCSSAGLCDKKDPDFRDIVTPTIANVPIADYLYAIEYDNYSSTPGSFEGLQELMKKVWYSRAYTLDPSSRDCWFTEWYYAGYSSAFMYKNYELCENPEFCDTIRKYLSDFNNPAYWHSDDSPLWYTTHTSVYDIKSKTLSVMVHEGRDGQTEFYQVSLDGEEFPKPLNAR